MSICTSKISKAEQETMVRYDPVDQLWYADTSVPKHMTKFKKQGWAVVDECHYEAADGPVIAMRFSASGNAIRIGNANPAKRKGPSQETINAMLAARGLKPKN